MGIFVSFPKLNEMKSEFSPRETGLSAEFYVIPNVGSYEYQGHLILHDLTEADERDLYFFCALFCVFHVGPLESTHLLRCAQHGDLLLDLDSYPKGPFDLVGGALLG